MAESAVDYAQPWANSSFKISNDNSCSEDGQVIPTEIFKGKDIRRSDTPATLLTELAAHPDITVLCNLCCVYISIHRMHYHHAYHRALLTFGYRHPHKPSTLKLLLHRRAALLKSLKAEATNIKPIFPRDIERLNIAYEILKSNLDDVDEEVNLIDKKLDTNVQSQALNCSVESVYAIGLAVSKNSHWKECMEDAYVYQDYFGEDRNKCYLAIFDGYHGSVAAERSSKELHQLLLHEMSKFDPSITSTIARNFAESKSAREDYEKMRPETRESFRVNLHHNSTEIMQKILDECYEKFAKIMKEKENVTKKTKRKRLPKTEQIHNAFKKAYLLMDIFLSYGKGEKSKVRWSGTSALTVIIEKVKEDNIGDGNDSTASRLVVGDSEKVSDKAEENEETLGLIHVANAGNSRALLVRGNRPHRLTKDHTLNNPKERKRVIKAGGSFNTNENSRISGVLSVTRGLGNNGDKRIKDVVITDPHVTTVTIDKHSQFLVLASNGVWEVFSDEEVAALLTEMLPGTRIPPPSRMSESLLPLVHREQRDVTSTSKMSNAKSDSGDVLEQNLEECQYQNLRCHINTDDEDVKSHKTGSNQSDKECFTLPAFPDSTKSTPEVEEEPRKELAKLMSEHLTQAALLAGAKDNVTVIVVLLPACEV